MNKSALEIAKEVLDNSYDFSHKTSLYKCKQIAEAVINLSEENAIIKRTYNQQAEMANEMLEEFRRRGDALREAKEIIKWYSDKGLETNVIGAANAWIVKWSDRK